MMIMFIPTFVSHLRPTLRIRTFTGSLMASVAQLPIVVFRSVAILVARAFTPVVMAPIPVPLALSFTLSISDPDRARGPGPGQHPDHPARATPAHVHNLCAMIPWTLHWFFSFPSFSPVSPFPSLSHLDLH